MKRATFYINRHCKAIYISIHALVKRATAEFLQAFNFSIISIHALVKRATFGVSCFVI